MRFYSSKDSKLLLKSSKLTQIPTGGGGSKNSKPQEFPESPSFSSVDYTDFMADSDSLHSIQYPDRESKNESDSFNSESDIANSEDDEFELPITPQSYSPYCSSVHFQIAVPISETIDFYVIQSGKEIDVAELPIYQIMTSASKTHTL